MIDWFGLSNPKRSPSVPMTSLLAGGTSRGKQLMRCLALLAFVLAWPAAAQPVGTITTVAGGGVGDGGPANAAPVRFTRGVAVDASGNVLIADTYNNRIRRVTPDGIISTVAGTGVPGFAGDGGPATKADLRAPEAVTADAAGNVYFSDTGNHRVRKVDASGVITTVAGNGTAVFSGDGGSGTAASLNNPVGLAIDGSGGLLICDSYNHRVRRMASGVITTVAGNGSPGTSGDGGPATSASASAPHGIVAVGSGGYFFTAGNRVRHVDAGGIIRTSAGSGSSAWPVDDPLGDGGPAIDASFYGAQELARDGAGNLYVADSGNKRIRKIDTAGIIRTVAGNGAYGFSGDGGAATAASLGSPYGVATDAAGILYIADTYNERVRKVDASGVITTVAGIGEDISTLTPRFTGDGLAATDARLSWVERAATDSNGDLLIQDNWRLRRVDASGIIRPDALTASHRPTALARDLAGNLFVVSGVRVYKVEASGTITHVAGNGQSGQPADGSPAIYAPLAPTELALDPAGNLYIVNDRFRVVRVDTRGIIRTVAGNGSGTFSGDGGPALAAGVVAVAVAADGAGNVYIAGHDRIRRIDTAGTIRTIAGNGTRGYGGDGGPAVDSFLSSPTDIAADALGNVYVVDAGNLRVRMIGTDGIIRTIAGNGTQGFAGDGGPATEANLHSPFNLSWDPAGSLWLTETNSIVTSEGATYLGWTMPRIRRISLPDASPAPFSFGMSENVASSAAAQSAVVTPTGYVSPTSISISGGEYSIGCTGVFVSAPGTINPGESICVRHVASAIGNADTITTLWIGGVPGTFTSRTLPGAGSVSIDPATLDLGGQSMLIATPTRLVTLSNTSSSTVTVNDVSVSNHFAVVHDCTTLAPGARCTATVTFTPLAAGAIEGTLRFQNSSGMQTVALRGTGEKSLTTHYYRSILGRDPDAPGKAFWDGEATRLAALGANPNEAWFALAMSFYFSPEYAAFGRTDEQFVADLYNTFFNRPPDDSGRSHWIGQLAEGLPREVLLASFMFSPEFVAFAKRIFGDTAARAEVDMVMDFYRGLLARLPDQEGFDFWVRRFRAAQCTRQPYPIQREANEISRQFATGDEYAARARTNAQYVGDLYNAFLRRGGDLPGVLFWIGRLDSGGHSREQALQAFALSYEFQFRVSRVISQGCLP